MELQNLFYLSIVASFCNVGIIQVLHCIKLYYLYSLYNLGAAVNSRDESLCCIEMYVVFWLSTVVNDSCYQNPSSHQLERCHDSYLQLSENLLLSVMHFTFMFFDLWSKAKVIKVGPVQDLFQQTKNMAGLCNLRGRQHHFMLRMMQIIDLVRHLNSLSLSLCL